MINFQEIDKNRFRNIHNLAVNPGQEAYVTADVEKFVHGWKDAADFDCFVITSGGRQVGFFAVDYNHQRHSAYVPEAEGTAVLRCFFIDRRYQKQGFARQALAHMNALLRPGVKALYLTVNFGNEPAQRVYLSENFKAVEKPYLGGASGPQHVLMKDLS